MATKAKTTRKAAGKKRSFHQELVLNRWVLGFFQGGTLGALKLRLGNDRHEGIDEDGQPQFFHELVRGMFDPNRVPEADLHRYKEVKTLEASLAKQVKPGEPPMTLNAFVLSPTKFSDLLNVGDPARKAELEDRHVLFMEEGGETYLKKLLVRVR